MNLFWKTGCRSLHKKPELLMTVVLEHRRQISYSNRIYSPVFPSPVGRVSPGIRYNFQTQKEDLLMLPSVVFTFRQLTVLV